MEGHRAIHPRVCEFSEWTVFHTGHSGMVGLPPVWIIWVKCFPHRSQWYGWSLSSVNSLSEVFSTLVTVVWCFLSNVNPLAFKVRHNREVLSTLISIIGVFSNVNSLLCFQFADVKEVFTTLITEWRLCAFTSGTEKPDWWCNAEMETKRQINISFICELISSSCFAMNPHSLTAN